MLKIKLTKEQADKLMKIPGNSRGLTLKTDAKYIIEKKGEEDFEKIRRRLDELGYPLDFENISSFGWYPIGLDCLVILIVMEIFGWDENDIFDIAYKAPIESVVSKLVLQSLTLESAFKNFQKYWRKYSDIGVWEVMNVDFKEKKATVILKDFPKFHPVISYYFMGFLKRILELTTKSKNVKIKQTKSIFKGSAFDEFRLDW